MTLNSATDVGAARVSFLCAVTWSSVAISTTPIASLGALENLQCVGGDMTIEWTRALEGLEGLSKLEFVGGSLTVQNNFELTTLAALSQLEFVGGSLVLRANGELQSISGLRGVGQVPGDLEIWVNRKLLSLAGLDGVASVGGSLHIAHNSSLEDLASLSALQTVAKSVVIERNAALLSLEGLGRLETIGADWRLFIDDRDGLLDGLLIGSNPSLRDLRGLESLRSVTRGVWITSNGELRSLAGLENLRTIASIDVCPNRAGGGLCTFWAPAILQISDNAMLSSVESLLNLTNFGPEGGGQISRNGALSSEDVERLRDHLQSLFVPRTSR